MQAFFQNMAQLFEAIEDCLEKRWLLPCLTLLYSGIDVVASLKRRPGDGTKAAFVRWVTEYMLKVHPLPCTALELYAARCGVVHAFTAESDLSRQGAARRLVYAWGGAKTEDLAAATKLLGSTDVAIHIRELMDGFRAGVAYYGDELARDPERERRIEAGSRLWFTHMDQNLVKKFLDVSQQSR
jgi:hypothetical protein